MNSEELNRAIEFIVEHQANLTVQLEQLGAYLKEQGARQDQRSAELAARQEQSSAEFAARQEQSSAEFSARQDRLSADMKKLADRDDRRLEALAELSKNLSELAIIQSSRLDRQDAVAGEIRAWQHHFEDEDQKRHDEVLARLKHVIEKLNNRSN